MKTYLSHISAVFTFLLLIFCAANEVLAQTPGQIDQLVKQLGSKEWQKREQAASTLMNLPPELRSEKVMVALVKELEKQFFTGGHKYEGEGEMEYSMWLMNAIASLQDDRAFPLIVKIGAPSAILRYGDKGMLAMIDKLKDMEACGSRREAFITYLGKAIEKKDKDYVAQGEIAKKIKRVLVEALEVSRHPTIKGERSEGIARECAGVRGRAVKALGVLADSGDTEVLPIIESLSKGDPYYWVPKGKPDEESNRKYDVREEAQKVIDELKAKGIKK